MHYCSIKTDLPNFSNNIELKDAQRVTDDVLEKRYVDRGLFKMLLSQIYSIETQVRILKK